MLSDSEFQNLVVAYLTGDLSSSSKELLLKALLENPERMIEFRELSRMHEILEKVDIDKAEISAKSGPANGWNRGNNWFYAAAALLIGALLSTYLIYRNAPLPPGHSEVMASFGDCLTDENQILQRGDLLKGIHLIQTNKYAACEIIQENSGRKVSARILPNSRVWLQTNPGSIQIRFETGKIVIHSVAKENPTELFVYSGMRRISLLGTKLQIHTNEHGSIHYSLLEGRIRIETSPLYLLEANGVEGSQYDRERYSEALDMESTETQIIHLGPGQRTSTPKERVRLEEDLKKSLEELLESRQNGEEPLKEFVSMVSAAQKWEAQSWQVVEDLEKREESEILENFEGLAKGERVDAEHLRNLVVRPSPDQIHRIIHLKNGTVESGFVFQEEEDFILLKEDRVIRFRAEEVESIEFQ